MLWRRVVCGVIALAVATLSAAHAQLTIIPQSRIDQVANPTTVGADQMAFEGEGVVEIGAVSEDLPQWSGSIGWTNKGPKPLAITRVQSTCSCVKATFGKRPIGSGERGVIEVSFVPKGRIGSVEQRLMVYTTLSDTHPTAIVHLRGRVTPSADPTGLYQHSCGPLLMMQRAVSFEATEGVQSERIAVMNGGVAPLTIGHDGRLTSPELKAYTEPQTLTPGQEGDLVIEYRPTEQSKGTPLVLYLKGLQLAPRKRQIEVILRTEE